MTIYILCILLLDMFYDAFAELFWSTNILGSTQLIQVASQRKEAEAMGVIFHHPFGSTNIAELTRALRQVISLIAMVSAAFPQNYPGQKALICTHRSHF